jgi:hypothetical protein
MAKNKKKSFSKVNVSLPIINSSDKNKPIKLDELNTIPSQMDVNNQLDEEPIELPNALSSDEYTETIKQLETNEHTITAEVLCNDEDCQKLKEHDCKISAEQSFTEKDECYTHINEDNNKVSDDTNLVIVNGIVETEVTLERDHNVSNNEEKKNTVELIEIQNKEKNTVELTEIQIKNEESETTEKKLTNCSRKFCCIL